MRTTGESGFSLIEVLVATFLATIIALAVAPMMLMAVQTSAIAQELTELTVQGSGQLEILRSLAFTDPRLNAGGSITSSAVGFSVDPVNGDPERYMRWQIVDDNAARKRVTLVVGVRNSIFGPPREFTLETFRTDIQ